MSKLRSEHLCVGAHEIDRAKKIYGEYGLIIVKGLIASNLYTDLLDSLSEAVLARLVSLGDDITDGSDLFSALDKLLAHEPGHAMEIIRLMKDVPAFFAFMTDKSTLNFIRDILGCRLLQCVHDIAQIRIDPAVDHTRNFDWHQDYQYNVASESAITGWIPLNRITKDMGFLTVLPGSHRRLLAVAEKTRQNVSGTGRMHSSYSLAADTQAFENSALEISCVEPGDAVLFHCWLIHRSGWNRGAHPRLVVNPRYSPALDPAVVRRGWITVRDRDQAVFTRLYPESVFPAKD